MDRASGTYGGEDNAYKVWWRFLKERNHLEDLDIDRSNIIIYCGVQFTVTHKENCVHTGYLSVDLLK
jgi:hypothetical protein